MLCSLFRSSIRVRTRSCYLGCIPSCGNRFGIELLRSLCTRSGKKCRRIANTESYKLTGLYPDTLYYVWLAARSQRGEGATTPPIPVRTKQYGKLSHYLFTSFNTKHRNRTLFFGSRKFLELGSSDFFGERSHRISGDRIFFFDFCDETKK